MKQLIFFILLLFIYSTVFSQKLEQVNVSAYNFRSKSIKARITGICMVSTGAALGLIGIPLGLGENPGDPNNPETKKLNRTGAILCFTGLAVGLAGIPFFIKAHRYKKMAREIKIQFKPDTIILPAMNSGYRNHCKFRIRVCINMGK